LNYAGTPEHEFGFYGEAFHAAGKSLVQQLKNDRQSLQTMNSFKALPILFMYRHAMELYLKDIILAGAGVLPLRREAEVDFRRLFVSHSLCERLKDVERIFKAFGWGWDFGLSRFRSLEDFRSAVVELENIDKESCAFRYPMRKDGSASLRRNFRFNLFEFCETLDPVYQVLEIKAFGARGEMESVYEMRAEARQYEMENYDLSDERESNP
jgi:hypothetical protein